MCSLGLVAERGIRCSPRTWPPAGETPVQGAVQGGDAYDQRPPGHAKTGGMGDVASASPPLRCLDPRIRPRSRQLGQSVTEFALIFPVLMVLVLAIGDFARWYSTAITVESAVREAADFGAFSASNWSAVNVPGTEQGMRERACTAASTLSGYQGDPVGTPSMTCTNPSFAYVIDPLGSSDCSSNANDPPCRLTVTLTYKFDLFIPVPIFPSSITFSRDSTFAVSPFPAS